MGSSKKMWLDFGLYILLCEILLAFYYYYYYFRIDSLKKKKVALLPNVYECTQQQIKPM